MGTESLRDLRTDHEIVQSTAPAVDGTPQQPDRKYCAEHRPGAAVAIAATVRSEIVEVVLTLKDVGPTTAQ
jgi:hypothetical protein